MLIEGPALGKGVTDAHARAAEHLAREAARVEDHADVGDRRVLDQRDRAGLDVHFDLGEADDVGVRQAVVRVRVLRDAHHAQAGERVSAQE